MHKSRKKQSQDRLGRFYTASPIAQTMVKKMQIHQPKRIIDLGAGAGSLTAAALQLWPNAQFTTIDKDKSSHRHVTEKLLSLQNPPKHAHISIDVFAHNLPEIACLVGQRPDVAICNPPFTQPNWKSDFGQIIDEAGFDLNSLNTSQVNSSIIFLGQNMRIIRNGGTIGIILPDRIISGRSYERFRKSLLERFAVTQVIRLPRNSFSNTDALAHIMILKKQRPDMSKVRLSEIDYNGTIKGTGLFDQDTAAFRLDYQYHAHQKKRILGSKRTSELREICTEIQRGTVTSKDIQNCQGRVLHTTNPVFKKYGKWIDLNSCFRHTMALNRNSENLIWAKPGDIVIARVGRNLDKKIIGIRKGQAILSDCMYRLRIKVAHRKDVLKYLASKNGRELINSISYGVGARHVAKSDLLSLVIPRHDNIPNGKTMHD